MKLILILMVRNESKIIQRCLKAVEGIVDAFCVHDTGSTDNTCELVEEFLQTHNGCLTRSKWQDFGYNRTESFREAKKFLRGKDLSDTYGLLLDADMVFEVGSLLDKKLGETGYTLIQKNGTLEYPNCRLVRMDHEWTCKGVTHEYWDGPTSGLPKSICYIDDRNDGGCKSDKFERDAILLEKGLAEEPANVRYMFYLAQTYHCVNRHKEAIDMYKKRIKAGGWIEEVWYSLYMIGQTHLTMENIPSFEKYMLKAFELRPNRAEPLYKLTKYFREKGQHFKAYQYMLMGTGIPVTTDSLFIEKEVYDNLFYYERTVLDYYVRPDKKDGARSTIAYLMKSVSMLPNVLSNLQFYAMPISSNIQKLNTPQPFGPEFRSSAISVGDYPFANVRYINYWIENGEYKTPNSDAVQTYNAYVNLDTMEVLQRMDDSTVGLPKRDHHIRGLEDVRLCGNDFTAVVQEYKEGVSVLRGKYGKDTGTYSECVLLPSPLNRDCEKNWLSMEGTSNMVYDWHPLRIVDKHGDVMVTHSTPEWFQLLRGSAPGKVYKGDLWILTHIVEYSKPRKYYHCFVKLEKDTYKPIAVSLPFVFKSPSIEYCVCFTMSSVGQIRFYVSFNDSDSSVVTSSVGDIEFVSI